MGAAPWGGRYIYPRPTISFAATALAILAGLFLCGLATAATCDDDTLTWDAPEPGASYRVALDGVTLGTTTTASWPIGCLTGLFSVVATDKAGNASEPSWYAEGGPCALGCIQPGGRLAPGACCCYPIKAPS